jgi:hypothetical protein
MACLDVYSPCLLQAAAMSDVRRGVAALSLSGQLASRNAPPFARVPIIYVALVRFESSSSKNKAMVVFTVNSSILRCIE